MKKHFIGIILLIILLVCVILGLCACNKNDPFAKNYPEFFSVQYIANTGGTIEGKDVQLVKYASSSEEVTAVASAGYYFLQWTDGITTPTRSDRLVTGDAKYYAEFALITNGVEVLYGIAGDGRIIGDSNQIVQYGADARKVEAQERVSNGARFLGWSDGYTERTRHDKNITEPINITARFGFSVEYNVDGYGSIVGSSHQDVVICEDAQSVTALPDKGYTFVGWSDGEKKATRTDKYIIEDKQITALFEWRDTDYFKYHYNYATENRSQFNLTLTRGKVDGVKSIVPEREFFTFGGWYFDENFIEKAFDENGNNLLGEEIFDSPSRDLYAKWTVIDEYKTTYKILMVYVTLIDGTFLGNDGKYFDIHYQMSEKDKAQCLKLSDRFAETLNDLLDGLVTFEIDSYFTTQSVSEKSFNNEIYETKIYADNIPELINSDILDRYRSVLTVFTFGGEKNLLTNWSGEASKKFATIPLDENLRLSESIEDTLNEFNGLISTCVHEFIHTMELGMVCYEYHRVCIHCVSEYVWDKLFLLNQYPVQFVNSFADNSNLWQEEYVFNAWKNSERVGIPYGFWINEIYDVVIKPECVNGKVESYGGTEIMDGGSIDFYVLNGDGWKRLNWDDYYTQRIPKGSRTTIIVARPDNGCRFLGWSDGVKDEKRIIYDVQSDLTIFAYFERQAYTVNYIAGEGGKIEGKTEQTLLVGERTEEVIVIADDGYKFVGWSDGYGNYGFRSDHIGQNEWDENGEWYYRLGFTVTAIFEKI